MVRVRLILTLFTFFSLSTIIYSQAFNQPESMVYDAVNDRYLITNMPDGDILARANDGTLSYFNQGASVSLRGITIFGSFVYAAGDEGVLVYSLLNDQYVETFPIAGANWINDICADPNGFLYVTDNNKVFKVNSDGGASSLFNDAVQGANGIIYDPANNRLLVTEDYNENGYVSALDMAGTTLTNLVNVPGKWLDGIAIDNDGNYYVGSWETGIIYKYDPLFANPAEVVVDNISGAADFCFNPIANELGIPLMDDNDIMFFQIGPPVGVEDVDFIPTSFALQQNYPNPFNPNTVISYQLAADIKVVLKVYDVLGKEVAELVNEAKPAGQYTVSFNASNLPSGVYIYTLQTNGRAITRKMLLLK